MPINLLCHQLIGNPALLIAAISYVKAEVKEQSPADFVLKPFDENSLRAAIQIAFHTYSSIIRFYLNSLEQINKNLMDPLMHRKAELL